ncbi:pyridoxamine 5'-phosphate oxidase family protein [Natronococcus wangiae]|uniref:pyridoxamine 5'-phosphate oxidase family protein n=1 Tax=Natronococcus wangiae TaxID=3068275 RepID=UPI0027402315|nr:pyridoxamine 5'-phosphate oxidase family protein [Natronococcus sp. AD5]
MQGLRWLQMSEREIHEFLGQGGTGVISFATGADTPPVSIPVSYGYNEDVEAFYFRLSIPPDSRKEELVERKVSFVTYDETDDGWQSVVATGQLEEVRDAPYASSTVQGMWGIDIPKVDIFERPREQMTFRDFQLAPERVTGRKEAQSQS